MRVEYREANNVP